MGNDAGRTDRAPAAGGAARRPAERRRRSAPMLAIALVSVALFANTLGNGLVGDDYLLILDHPAVGQVWDLSAIAGTSFWGQDDDLYRPLTIWSLALNHAVNRTLGLAGEHPAGYHLFNLLVHLGVGLAFHRLMRVLGAAGWPALAAALLFAALPIHTEAVATVVGRAELLTALFGLSFLILHRAGPRTVTASLCLLLALCSKESAITFLPLVVWMDACFSRGAQRFRPGAYGVYLGVAGAWLALRGWALVGRTAAIPFIDNPLVEVSVAERVLTALRVQFDYLRLQLLPFGLSSDYSFDQIPVVSSVLEPRLLAVLSLGAVASWGAWIWRKKQPALAFLVVGYAISFSVTSNILFPIGTIMGERLAYSPSLAVCALLGYAAFGMRRAWGAWVAGVVALVLLVFGVVTLQRNRSWESWESYVAAQAQSAPASAKTHYNVAIVQFEAGEFEAAALSCRRAVAILPGYAESWDRLGLALAALGDLETAAQSHLRALEIYPGFAMAHYRLGLVRQRQGRLDAAAASYSEAIALDPNWAAAYSNLGTIHATRGELDEAERLWRKALELDPDYAVARNNLDMLERSRRP